MRKFPLWAAALLLSAGPGLAQSTSQSVTVNPGAIGSRPLLYPGGEYLRLQRPLLQPGQTNAPIRLRPPGTRPASTSSAPAPAASVAPQPAAPRPVASAPATPAARPAAPPPQQVAAAPPPARTVPPATASVAGNSEMADWDKSGLIEFLPDQGEVQTGRMDAVRFLAGALNNSLAASPAARVELLAFGGVRGDKGSDARRLSLRRALSVRQILIDSGIAEGRINVRAMGGADDGGPADRVDVYVHS